MSLAKKEQLRKLSGRLILLLFSPLILALAPIWIPIYWYVERKFEQDMSRPRGCLTYQIPPEGLVYFEAMIQRERQEEARALLDSANKS
jgi:hypothetical protein